MMVSLIKTAHNPLIYEVQDFGVGLSSHHGHLLADGSGLPGFIGCLPRTVRSGLEVIGADDFADGDILLSHEPYDTGTHISDTVVYMPIFHDDRLEAFSAIMAHWADIGGITPGGWCPDSTDVHQEGLLFPHLKLYDAGRLNRELHRLILANVRFPGIVGGRPQRHDRGMSHGGPSLPGAVWSSRRRPAARRDGDRLRPVGAPHAARDNRHPRRRIQGRDDHGPRRCRDRQAVHYAGHRDRRWRRAANRLGGHRSGDQGAGQSPRPRHRGARRGGDQVTAHAYGADEPWPSPPNHRRLPGGHGGQPVIPCAHRLLRLCRRDGPSSGGARAGGRDSGSLSRLLVSDVRRQLLPHGPQPRQAVHPHRAGRRRRRRAAPR